MRGILMMKNLLVLVLMMMSGVVFAASSSGLRGNITANDGKALPGMTVQITDPVTGLSRQTKSSTDGDFLFPSLPAGLYRLVIAPPEFKPFTEEVRLVVGETTVLELVLAPEISEEIVVSSAEQLLDVRRHQQAFSLSPEELSREAPIQRNIASLVQLAPSVTIRNGLPSIGGAATSENAFKVNGMNITAINDRMGFSTVPMAFIQELQVESGGFRARHGGATGGTVNMITRRGGNQLSGGVTTFWTPAGLRETSPDTAFALNGGVRDENREGNIYLGGPLIKDRLFFFALANPESRDRAENRITRENALETREVFWGAGLDWHITPYQLLSLSAFSDERDLEVTTYIFDGENRNDVLGTGKQFRGGDTVTARYDGVFGDNLVVTAEAGFNQHQRTDRSDKDENPVILDGRSGPQIPVGNWINFFVTTGEDERQSFGLDVAYHWKRHELQIGFDVELSETSQLRDQSGGVLYLYQSAEQAGNWGIESGSDFMLRRIWTNGGTFNVRDSAWYIEDSWRPTDRLSIYGGLRFESFINENARGDRFIESRDEPAARAGLVWDIRGNGRSRIYANAGRYYLPVPTSVNVRFGGSEFIADEFFPLEGVDATTSLPRFDENSPVLRRVIFNGTVPEADTIRTTNLKPLYQDEINLGLESMVGENWTLGLRATWRELGNLIEDFNISWAAVELLGANPSLFPGSNRALFNPGRDVSISVDTDGDGATESYFFSADELNLPRAERNYGALELTWEGRKPGRWAVQGSYTWSHAYGNTGGQSENLFSPTLSDFDVPSLAEGARGNLSNDRRHRLKVWGHYQLGGGFSVGTNILVQSGEAYSAWGPHPEDPWGNGSAFYLLDELTPRGSLGKTPTFSQLDMSLSYAVSLSRMRLNLNLDIFNVTNEDTLLQVRQWASFDSVNLLPEFEQPTAWQEARSVRFSAGLSF